jgi:hypothetical protein
VQDCAQGPDVRAGVGPRPAACGHLRAHVPRRAQERARQGLLADFAADERRGAVVCLVARQHAGEAPVEQPRLAEVADDHVLRLHVAVDHAARVREGQRLAHPSQRLDQPTQGPARVSGVVRRDRLGQGHAAALLHGEVPGAGLVPPESVHRRDPRVLEERGHPRLVEEPPEAGGRRPGQALHRDPAVQAGVEGDAHLALAALPQQAFELVGGAGVRDRRGEPQQPIRRGRRWLRGLDGRAEVLRRGIVRPGHVFR